jgi:hypothetical protein
MSLRAGFKIHIDKDVQVFPPGDFSKILAAPRHQPSEILETREADNAGIFNKNRLKYVKNSIFLKLKHRQIENNNNGIARKFIGDLTIKVMSSPRPALINAKVAVFL